MLTSSLCRSLSISLSLLLRVASCALSDEPPASQRKYIGARVIDGVYTLIDPTEDTAPAGENDDHEEEDSATVATNSTTPTTGTSIVPKPSRKRHESVSSVTSFKSGGMDGGNADDDDDGNDGGGEGQDTIRMPPSLTLSKIRSLKQQALVAALKAKLEISTVALAIVYFERLCL